MATGAGAIDETICAGDRSIAAGGDAQRVLGGVRHKSSHDRTTAVHSYHTSVANRRIAAVPNGEYGPLRRRRYKHDLGTAVVIVRADLAAVDEAVGAGNRPAAIPRRGHR